jgi:hypothetical protein
MIEWAAWARPGRGGGSAVVAVTGEAWAAELPKLCPDARVLAVATDRGQLCLRLAGAEALLLLLAEPPKKGSVTAGNYLPW